MNLRKIFFWLHLAAGVVAGIVIGVMCVTGVALAFEKEIVAWAERDVRKVTPPTPDAPRLPVETLLGKVYEVQPNAMPSGITVWSDPRQAVQISFGRTNSFYADPYTGKVQPQGAAGTRAFMHLMIDWHRYLGGHGDNRAIGKAVTGACNAAFLFLGLSGLYLWWPRQWTKSAVRAIALFNFKLSGKARDWNWHNVIGLWCAPVLIVLTATAMPISYRWASDLVYKMMGSPVPTAAGPGAAPAVEVPKPAPGTPQLSYDALLASVQKQSPSWEQITLRIGGAPGGGGGGGPRGGEARGRGADASGSSTNAAAPTPRPERSGPPAVSVAVKQGEGPRFVQAQLSLDPFTGAVLRTEDYASFNAGRKVRSWTRFLHTGEALGPIGQAVAGLASLGGAVLVWTGFALAWRRFRGWLGSKSAKVGVGAPALESVERPQS